VTRESSTPIDAISVATWYLIALFGIPAVYVFGPLGSIGAPAIMIGWLAFAWWTVSRFLPDSGLDRDFQPIRVALFFFVVTVLVSLAVTNLAPMASDQSTAADRAVLFILSLLGVALLIADGVVTFDRLRVFLRRLVDAGAFLAIVGIVEYVTKLNFVTSIFEFIPGLSKNSDVNFAGGANVYSNIVRVSGTAVHPIEFGVVLSMVLPLAVVFAFTDTKRTGFARWWKVGIIAMAEPMAQSRSGILALIVGAIVLLPALPRSSRRTMLKWSPAFIVGMRLIFPGLIGTIFGLFANFQSDPNFTSRTADYKRVGGFIAQSPIFGRGFGTFLPKDFFFLDNQYILSTIETGYVGLAITIALLLTGVGLAFQARRWALTDERRLVAQALLASLLGGALAFATFDFLTFQMATGVLFLLLGCSAAAWRILRREAYEEGRRRPTKPRKIDVFAP
jgi:hypothetical protein